MKTLINNITQSILIVRNILRIMERREKTLLLLFVFISILMAISEGVGIGIFAQMLNSITNTESFSQFPMIGDYLNQGADMSLGEKLRVIASLLIMVVLVRAILQYLVQALAAIIPTKLIKRLTYETYLHIQASKFSFIQERGIGNTVSEVTGHPGNIGAMVQNLGNMISNFCLIVFYTILLTALSPTMMLIAVIGMLVGTVLLKLLTEKKSQLFTKEVVEANGIRIGVLNDSIGGGRMIRLLNGQQTMIERWKIAIERYQNSTLKLLLITAVPSPFMMGFVGCMGGGAIWFMLLTSNEDPQIWLTQIILFLAILLRMQGPVSAFNAAMNFVIGRASSLDLFLEFTAKSIESEQPSGTLKFKGLQKGIEFRNLNFAYDNQSNTALSDISFKVKKGSFVAIVGPSGSGKSTTVGLINRLYDAEAGMLLLDDKDILEYDVQSVREHVGVVSQDIFLFNDSVLENIKFAQNKTDQEVIDAAKRASAHDFIMDLPDGYSTLIGERGTRLSGGQQQRIALARAILSDNDILILDEATSQLDSYTENAIQQTIFELARERTLIAIAHRLSTIQHADLVIVIKDGKIIEVGDHNELMSSAGVYQEMRGLQELSD